MPRRKFLPTAFAVLVALVASSALAPAGASAQKKQKKQEPTTGAVSGRVRVAAGATPGGVSVFLRRGDQEVAQVSTNAKGEFSFQNVEPGSYGLTLRKPGLEVGRMEGVEVRAGKTLSLKEGLYLPIDEGSIASVRGSVFSAAGRSFNGARVELARVEADGSLKKLDTRVSNVAGQFSFKLAPERAKYRLTAKADGMEPATQDLEVDGAAIYRVALSLEPARK
ncbi:MAG TPA: carboxypeptidase-like regulatory domain-containing protein [Pyrinomonadaceae bacterium]|jgi:hypothetical protein